MIAQDSTEIKHYSMMQCTHSRHNNLRLPFTTIANPVRPVKWEDGEHAQKRVLEGVRAHQKEYCEGLSL